MRILKTISDYWEYMIASAGLVYLFPLDQYNQLYNLNLSIWGIVLLCLVSEINHTRQKIKKAETYYMLDTTPEKPRSMNERIGQWAMSMSWDTRAYLIFAAAVIIFFGWLVVFA